MRPRETFIASLALAASLLAGCNDVLGIREPSHAVLDTGSDAGQRDAAPPELDASEPAVPDAATSPDAASSPDAAVASDAGTSPDAAAATDAAAPLDAASQEDAGA